MVDLVTAKESLQTPKPNFSFIKNLFFCSQTTFFPTKPISVIPS